MSVIVKPFHHRNGLNYDDDGNAYSFFKQKIRLYDCDVFVMYDSETGHVIRELEFNQTKQTNK